MTPAARVSAAIELLDAVIAAAQAGGSSADALIAQYFRTRRYAGSKDRRAVRDLVFATLRALGEQPASGRAALLGYAQAQDPALLELFTGEGHAPAPLLAGEDIAQTGFAPQWIVEKLAPIFGDDAARHWAALQGRAPLDMRVNRLKADVATVQAAFPEAMPITGVPDALRLTQSIALEQHPLYANGAFEVQDAGSQMIAIACAARAGMVVVDLCAGAGGKTLALAAQMHNQGQLIACDSDRGRLSRLEPRALRAGATNISARLLNPPQEAQALADLMGQADVVLVDAPCSGTGTWRRTPEAKWRLTPARLARLVATQANLLNLASQLVKPGGRLVYAVCSLLPEEGPQQWQAWQAGHGDWLAASLGLPVAEMAPGQARLTPLEQGCDGFFIAAAQRPC